MAYIEYNDVIFEWDDNKAQTNLQKHKLSFETAHFAFFDPNALTKPHKIVDGEQRFKTLARIENSLIVVFIVHLYENHHPGGKEYIRIISARRAESKEEKEYYHAY
ncbi:BrnT family toxin [Lonepinella koalarum]|uniref:Uncharacterized protein n=1 Tax=Lonepinella koalarum TaxID=53417 RepID=A0A4R1KPH9_9PAST|nr:BrnT family toxin [Lonepinella koalarum]MDH2926615.1 hypothetical protein [Lonepinella koalarum]TCK66935.1 hypothetical protein EV692_2205 [Lonepinella koalarum]TFJ88990.1 BrnT family toxin [Lonepinella koalarum]